MRILVYYFLLAILLRFLGTILRGTQKRLALRSIGWLMCISAVWSATQAIEFSSGWWLIIPVTFIGVLFETFMPQLSKDIVKYLWWAAIETVALLFFSLFAVPSPGIVQLFAMTAIIIGLGLVLDWTYLNYPKYRMGTAVLFPLISLLILFSVRPDLPTTALRMLQDRYYVAFASTTVPRIPTPTPASFNSTGTQWAPYLEWHLTNPSFEGNPYDVTATVTFNHQESSKTHTTEMFFDGNNTWKFRFTGTRPGKWSFITQSPDSDLDGQQGQIMIEPNPDPVIKGFLTTSGNKFAIQSGEAGTLKAYRFNAYMNLENFNVFGPSLFTLHDSTVINAYLQEARLHGFDTIFLHPGYPNVWTDGSDPNRVLFQVLEKIITTAHGQGMRVHIWAWADAARGGTPPGGINSLEDKRLQRYIAARLGPLPGWTMGYGFDLFEWTTEDDLQEWAGYLKDHFGWSHLLWGRNRFNAALDVNAHATIHGPPYPETIPDVIDLMRTDPQRPHLYEERFSYGRFGKTMADSRRTLWHLTMAGGAGGFWGHYSRPVTTGYIPPPYPNPEQFRTAGQFWQDRFTLEMKPTNDITDGWALKNVAADKLIFYKEETDTIQMDLSEISGPQSAVAVDTVREYAELELGVLAPRQQTWAAPYISDWAIAVGEFHEQR